MRTVLPRSHRRPRAGKTGRVRPKLLYVAAFAGFVVLYSLLQWWDPFGLNR